jgi:transposase
LFRHVGCEARVPADHPQRVIRAVVDESLEALCGEFGRRYARVGRPSIAPEKPLRALLLQAVYAVRSGRQLMEQLDDNPLFRWFVGLAMDARVWDASTFFKNRDRLLGGDVAQAFLAAVVAQPRAGAPMSAEYVSADGPLIQAGRATNRSGPAARAPPRRHRATRVAAMPRPTGAARSARTGRMLPPPPTRTPGWPARPTGSRASSPMPVMC